MLCYNGGAGFKVLVGRRGEGVTLWRWNSKVYKEEKHLVLSLLTLKRCLGVNTLCVFKCVCDLD